MSINGACIYLLRRVASRCVFDISLERNLNIFQVENSKLLQISFLQLCIGLQLKIEKNHLGACCREVINENETSL